MPSYTHPHICQCLTRLRQHSPVTSAGDRLKSGREFVDSVLSLSRGLLGLGLGSGDVIAVAAFNSDLYLEWILAISFIGGIVAPLNYRWSFEEARFAMETVRPVMLVTDKSCVVWFSKPRADELPSLTLRVSMDSTATRDNPLTTESIRKRYMEGFSSDYSWAPEGKVLICFTSGTTGRPKGVTISHSALIFQSLAKIAIVGYSEDDVYLHTAPLCHIGGLSSAISMLLIGGFNVLIPKFEGKAAIEAIKQRRVTSLITVPAMMADLISTSRGRESWKRIESVNKILNGGGELSNELIEKAKKLFPRAKLISAYGMTEACSSLTFMTIYDTSLESSVRPKPVSNLERSGVCVGKPAPHVDLKIRSDGSSNVGKILTRGPHVMLGYWDQNPSDLIDEHWLDTGDIGSLDDCGNLWLLGRTNGRIKSGGENIYPEEIEAIVSQHPGILGIVAMGIPDARLTEMVVACVLLRTDWQWLDRSLEDSGAEQEKLLSQKILQRYCEEKNLARFKIPKKFLLWKKSFPVTSTGKIIRQEVQKAVVSRVQSLHSSL